MPHHPDNLKDIELIQYKINLDDEFLARLISAGQHLIGLEELSVQNLRSLVFDHNDKNNVDFFTSLKVLAEQVLKEIFDEASKKIYREFKVDGVLQFSLTAPVTFTVSQALADILLIINVAPRSLGVHYKEAKATTTLSLTFLSIIPTVSVNERAYIVEDWLGAVSDLADQSAPFFFVVDTRGIENAGVHDRAKALNMLTQLANQDERELLHTGDNSLAAFMNNSNIFLCIPLSSLGAGSLPAKPTDKLILWKPDELLDTLVRCFGSAMSYSGKPKTS